VLSDERSKTRSGRARREEGVACPERSLRGEGLLEEAGKGGPLLSFRVWGHTLRCGRCVVWVWAGGELLWYLTSTAGRSVGRLRLSCQIIGTDEQIWSTAAGHACRYGAGGCVWMERGQ